MPDFERRSSASFISSKEGGTPASFSRSLMKRRSSYCLRVSISSIPPVGVVFSSRISRVHRGSPQNSQPKTLALETNHERTLYVRYVFRNHLISGERGAVSSQGRLNGAPQGVIPAAAGSRKASLVPRPAQMADVSQVPVPQRDSRATTSPDGSQASQLPHRPRALRGAREDSLRAGRWR